MQCKQIDLSMAENSKNPKPPRFKTVTEKEKEDILSKRKSVNTNLATTQWITCLQEYLCEKQLQPLDRLSNSQLNEALGNFYCEARKKNVQYLDSDDPEEQDRNESYKTTSLRAARGAFTRFFKDSRNVDIRTDAQFITSNQMFLGQTKVNKEKGLGNVSNKPAILEEDMKKLNSYFRGIMSGPPNARGLMQIIVFHIIYYLCRRGRENLRAMKKTTFAIDVDPSDGRKFIYQKTDEADKNHGPNDTEIANQGRIYQRLGS